MAVSNIGSSEELKALPAFSNGLLVISFWTSWSQPSVQTNKILGELQVQYKNITFVQVEAEEVGDVTEAFGVDSVPCVLFLQVGVSTGSVVLTHKEWQSCRYIEGC